GIGSCVPRSELVEALLLLVAERIVEFLKRRAYRLHRLQRCIKSCSHRIQTSRRREREGIFQRARRFEHCSGVLTCLAYVAEKLLRIGIEAALAFDVVEWPRGNSAPRLSAPPPHGRIAGARRSGIARASWGGHGRCIG